MNTKIVAAQTFPGEAGKSALDAACAWLSEHCSGGYEPLAVVAKGDKRRVTISGPEGGALVFVKV